MFSRTKSVAKLFYRDNIEAISALRKDRSPGSRGVDIKEQAVAIGTAILGPLRNKASKEFRLKKSVDSGLPNRKRGPPFKVSADTNDGYEV